MAVRALEREEPLPMAGVPLKAWRWPSSRSADLRILRAWLDASAAHPGDLQAIVAAVETAVMESQVVDARRVLGKYYNRVPEEVRPLLGRPGEAGLQELLGHFVKWERNEAEALKNAVLAGRRTNPETGWIEGLAGLTERETKAYWLRIRGRSGSEIARELTDPMRRHDRSQWTALKTVYNLCWQAKVKVLGAFGLPPGRRDDDDEGGWDA